MAYLGGSEHEGRTRGAWADITSSKVTGLTLVGLLGVVVLGGAAGGPDWFFAWRITSLFLLFTGMLILSQHLISGDIALKDLPAVLVLLVGILVGLCGAIVFGGTTGGPNWSLAGRITGLFLLVAGAFMLGQSSLADDSLTDETGSDRIPAFFIPKLTLLVGLLFIIYQSSSPGIGLGIHRTGELLIIFLTLVVFCVLADDPRQYTPVQWVVIGCFGVVVGLFYYHSLAEVAGGLPARRPLWSSVIMGISLFVLPQYVSREEFLWALNRLAAVLVVLALPIYVIGEYSLFGLQFTFHDAYTVPIVEYELRATRSLFVNRNAFAVAVFAGLIAAVGEFHRAFDQDRVIVVAIPSVLLVVNASGLALAYGRALWVITPVVLGIYVAHLVFGRSAVPIAVLGGLAYFASGIVVVHTGLIELPGNPPTRMNRWYPAIAAILDQPSLLGEGLIAPGHFIADYHPTGSAGSPHNSYLSIWIRTGIVGGIAYLGLVGMSLLRGIWQYRTVDIGVLVLAIGLAAHQMFEAYTMFRWGIGSVLATLAIGFLVFGWSNDESTSTLDK